MAAFGQKFGIDFLLPFRYNPVEALTSKTSPIGERCISYFMNKQKGKILETLSAQYQSMDSKRNMLVNSTTFSVDRAQLFVEYIMLVQSLTKDIDFSSKGANIQFIWNDQTKYEVEFDFICIGINLIATGLKCFTNSAFSSLQSAAEQIKNVGALKLIFDSCSSYIHLAPVSWAPAIEPILWAAQCYALITVFYYNGKFDQASCASESLISKFKATINYDPQYLVYWGFFSIGIAIHSSIQNKTVSKTLAYFIIASQRQASIKNMKFKDPAVGKKVNEIIAWIEQKKDEQSRVIPSSVLPEKGVFMHELDPILAFKIPEISTASVPIEQIKAEIVDSVAKSVKKFETEIGEVLSNQLFALDVYPSNDVSSLEGQYQIFKKVKDIVSQKIVDFVTLLNAKRGELGPRYDQIFQEFNKNRQLFQVAQNSDNTMESNFAKAKLAISEMSQASDRLQSIQDEMNKCLDEARNYQKGLQRGALSNVPGELIQKKGEVNTFFINISIQLQRLFDESRQSCNQLKSLGNIKLEEFKYHSVLSIKFLQQGTTFYKDLENVLKTLESKI